MTTLGIVAGAISTAFDELLQQEPEQIDKYDWIAYKNTGDIRLDFAVAGTFEKEMTLNDLMDSMEMHFFLDVMDIVQNGDTESSDPTLKAFDGAQKLGKSLESMKVTPCKFIVAPNSKHDLTEYHVFFCVETVWN